MNKSELVKAMSEEARLTAKDAAELLDAFVHVTTKALSKGDTIALVGFGNFSVSERSARTARNFRTKEIIHVPASKSVRFKVGKGLKEAINCRNCH
jgi:DNA-binding protein HU-beta